jgi:cytochrome c-type biogenesis protein CcmH/NrfF
MFPWKSKFVILAALVTAALLAQNASEDVRRVGSRLACMCGCSHTVASCDMFECGFSKPAKLRIAKLKDQGVSDQAIVDLFVKENGDKIFRAEPNSFGWIIPYASLLPGLLLIWWFMRRYWHPKPVPELGAGLELDDPELAKYKDQIDKDLARLD